ncbi:hypothetical protein V8D89_000356 [Ganoderma adspersum]
MSAKPYIHLANLLNVKKDIVAAATGTIGRKDMDPVIIYSTNSKKSIASMDDFQERTFPVKDQTYADAKKILTMPRNFATYQGITLEKYVQDLFCLLRIAASKNTSPEERILRWVTYHNWSKLHKRLSRAKQFQCGNIFDVLKTWTLSEPDFDICSRHKLTLHNIEPDQDPIFTLNMYTAEELVHSIASAFTEIEAIDLGVSETPDMEPKATKTKTPRPKGTKTENPRPKPEGTKTTGSKSEASSWERITHNVRYVAKGKSETEKADIDLVVEDLLFLSTILENKAVQDLFTYPTLHSKLMPGKLRRLQIQADALTPPVNNESNTQDPEDVVLDSKGEEVTDAIEGDDELKHLSHSESAYKGGFALRYMRMLVSPATALQYLFRDDILCQLAAAPITLITLVEKPRRQESLRGTVYNSVEEAIQKHIISEESVDLQQRTVDASVDWLEKEWNAVGVASESACHIHAEAGLMALAYNARRQERDNAAMDEPYNVAFKGVTKLPIGINMKCCSLCYRLGQHLNSESSVDISFQLPDTHEVIFAWDPPKFGIPDSVLKKLRDDLHDQVVFTAIKHGSQEVNRTSQSSPTSGSQRSQTPGGKREDIDLLWVQGQIDLHFAL